MGDLKMRINRIFKQRQKGGKRERIFRKQRNFFEKAIKKLKGEWKYRIEFPSVDRAEGDIEIEIHCDDGQILA